jgi:2-hydroxy-6-oxonona-2,4-dienedioate hydrolase
LLNSYEKGHHVRETVQTFLNERFVSVDGYRIRYLYGGNSKQTLVLIHGLGASAERWLGIVPYLRSRYRLIIPDLIGFGYSDKPNVDYTMDFFSRFVIGFLETLGIEQANFVGSSLGGQIVAECAHARDDMMRKIVLVAPSGIMKHFTPALTDYMTAVFFPTFENAWRAFSMMIAKGEPDANLVNDFITRIMFPNSDFAFLSAILGIKYSNLEPKLGKIHVPTLIVWGKQDKIIPVEYASSFVESIRNSKFAEMEDCGHVPFVEQPKRFAEILLDFLNRELVHDARINSIVK